MILSVSNVIASFSISSITCWCFLFLNPVTPGRSSFTRSCVHAVPKAGRGSWAADGTCARATWATALMTPGPYPAAPPGHYRRPSVTLFPSPALCCRSSLSPFPASLLPALFLTPPLALFRGSFSNPFVLNSSIFSFTYSLLHRLVREFSNLKKSKRIRSTRVGVPIVARQKRTWLASMRTQVPSLASLSGLRIQCCRELWCTLQMRLGSGVAGAVA